MLLKCSTCKQEKAEEDFHKHKNPPKRNNHTYDCKVCSRAAGVLYRKDNSEHVSLKNKEYREKCPLRMKKWRAENPDKMAVYHQRKYEKRHTPGYNQKQWERIKSSSELHRKVRKWNNSTSRRYRRRHRDKISEKYYQDVNGRRTRILQSKQKKVDELDPSYVKMVLGFKTTQRIPESLIEAKRTHILLKRVIKSKSKKNETD